MRPRLITSGTPRDALRVRMGWLGMLDVALSPSWVWVHCGHRAARGGASEIWRRAEPDEARAVVAIVRWSVSCPERLSRARRVRLRLARLEGAGAMPDVCGAASLRFERGPRFVPCGCGGRGRGCPSHEKIGTPAIAVD